MHTPEPWTFIGNTLVQDRGNRRHIGAFTEAPGMGSAAEANARLIAAAPELLTALHDLLDDLEFDMKTSPAGAYRMVNSGKRIAQARAAIARATREA